MKEQERGLRNRWRGVRAELPRLGTAGSRSSALHASNEHIGPADSRLFDVFPVGTPDSGPRTLSQLRYFFALRWMGTTGALMISIGGLGAGALPVVTNPYDNLPLGPLLSRMLQSTSALVFVGIALLTGAWVLMAGFVGAPLTRLLPWRRVTSAQFPAKRLVTVNQLWRTWAGWVIPLVPTAPLFTQDIYSYLANGSILRQGLDPYSAGPVQLLGADNVLARSVPFIWANSPSPYGPVSLGLAELVSLVTQDSILLGVIAHRVLSLVGCIAAGWAMVKLARRCQVSPTAALWLGLLNPLAILHLIGGIHNEAILLGFVLGGMEVGLRGIDKLDRGNKRHWLGWILLSGFLISCAGMVKVTGFIGLGFIGMSLARAMTLRWGVRNYAAIFLAAAIELFTLLFSIALISLISGIGLGWIFGQGGAATIRSWLSLSTDVGIVSGFLSMLLGLGDHTDAILTVTRTIGVGIAVVFMARMLLATYQGSIHPVGGLGVATLVLVIFFPVVHPWYILWAVFPLAAWANRHLFRNAVVLYSVPMSFVVLPRGLGLPPSTVAVIYAAALGMVFVVAVAWRVALRRAGINGLD